MSSKRVLITGGTGFLGRHTAERFRNLGHKVTVLGRNAEIGALLESQGFRFQRVKLEDRESSVKACANHELIIHCAALAAPWGSPKVFEAANVIGTQNIIEATRLAGAQRLVHISTPSVFVEKRERFNLTESDPLPVTPIGEYSRTKRLAEYWIDQAAAQGLPVITLRPQGIFGPGDQAIFPRIIETGRRGVFPIIGNGNTRFDLTYVDNVVDAIALASEAPTALHGRKFHITNGDPRNFYEVIFKIFDEIGIRYRTLKLPRNLAFALAQAAETAHRFLNLPNEPRLTRYSVCLLAYSRTLSIEAARRDLGYTPRVGVDEGLQRFVKWYRETFAD